MTVKPLSQSGLDKTGWNKGEGDVLLVHPKLGKLIQVAVCDTAGKPIYDQFIHAEPIGAVTIPVNSKGEIGLIGALRWTANPARYDFETIENHLDILGMVSVEFPRGFPHKGEAPATTAMREGGEELGSPIISVEKLGVVTPNTTFHPHQIPVYLARVDETFVGDIPGDVNERVLAVDYVSSEVLRDKIARGEIYCGFTLAAIGLALALNKF